MLSFDRFEIASPYAGKSPPALTINPFWEKVKQLPGDRVYWELYHRYAPKAFSFRRPGEYIRDDLCREYAWAISDPASVQFVAQWLQPRAVEVGAGRGYWAWQVAQLGVDILCFDVAPPDTVFTNHWHSPRSDKEERDFLNQPVSIYHPVAQGDESVLLQHADRTLFLCWPPYASDMALNCLNSYTGSCLVYIGEGSGGCTGDGAFHERLEEDWEEVASHHPVQWDGIHDEIYVYTRKENTRMTRTATPVSGRGRGFASMSEEKKRQVASLGGKEAHRLNRAHKWTPEEAREAGRKGGTKSRRGRSKKES